MSKGLATQMKEALDAVDDAACVNDAPYCGCCAARIKPAIAGLEGITDEMIARMDWAAELIDEDIANLKRGLSLLKGAAKARGDGDEKRAITRLADELEALP